MSSCECHLLFSASTNWFYECLISCIRAKMLVLLNKIALAVCSGTSSSFCFSINFKRRNCKSVAALARDYRIAYKVRIEVSGIWCLKYYRLRESWFFIFQFCIWDSSRQQHPLHVSRDHCGSIFHTPHIEPIHVHPFRHRRSNSDKFGNRSHNTCFHWNFAGKDHKFALVDRPATSFYANGSAVPRA